MVRGNIDKSNTYKAPGIKQRLVVIDLYAISFDHQNLVPGYQYLKLQDPDKLEQQVSAEYINSDLLIPTFPSW